MKIKQYIYTTLFLFSISMHISVQSISPLSFLKFGNNSWLPFVSVGIFGISSIIHQQAKKRIEELAGAGKSNVDKFIDGADKWRAQFSTYTPLATYSPTFLGCIHALLFARDMSRGNEEVPQTLRTHKQLAGKSLPFYLLKSVSFLAQAGGIIGVYSTLYHLWNSKK